MTRFSVIMPAWNAGPYIEAALDSVASQTFRSYEIVVADDGSTDDTVRRVRAWQERHPGDPVRLVELAHSGPGAARNAALGVAVGEWICFLDADDVWLPGKLAVVDRAAAEHPEAGLIAHGEFEIHPDGRRVPIDPSKRHEPGRSFFVQLYTKGNYLATSGTSVRRQILDQAGLFDDQLPSAQDYDLWLRVALHADPVILPAFAAHYVLRPGNISSRIPMRLRCLLLIADRYFAELATRVPNPRALYLKRVVRFYASAVRTATRRGWRGWRYAWPLAREALAFLPAHTRRLWESG